MLDKNARIMQDSSWADGLRGIAAIYVAASHIVLCFARKLVNPCCGDDELHTPHLFQRPIFRLIASGHSWVAVFLVLLGFVNALKPIKQARSNNVEGALAGLSTAAFRRSFRLVLPAATATVISWALCQMGAYEISRNSDAFWLYMNTPAPSDSWGTALEDLVNAVRRTWLLTEDNPYDQPQWALVYLLLGSIMAFFVLLATVSLTPKWRMITVAMCVIWSWNWSLHLIDPLVGYTVLSGVLLAEFSQTTYPQMLSNLPFVSSVIAPFAALIGLVFMSFPSGSPETVAWSYNLLIFFARTFPAQLHWDMPRLSGSTGAILLCAAILCSSHLRRALSVAPLRWLGKNSFPIYLLHGTFMRTVMAWIVFGSSPVGEFEEDLGDGDIVRVGRYAQPGAARIWFGIIISMGLMLAASHVWTNKLEPRFGRITAWAESRMKGADEGHGILNGKPAGSEKQG